MKPVHKRAIKSQAAYLRKMCKEVRLMSEKRYFRDGGRYMYSKFDRMHIRALANENYKPEQMMNYVKFLSDIKAAAIFRKFYEVAAHNTPPKTPRLNDGQRYRSLQGNFYAHKALLCDHFFQ